MMGLFLKLCNRAGSLRGALLLPALIFTAIPCLGDIQGGGKSEKPGGDKKKANPAEESVKRAVEIPTPKDQTVRAVRGQPLTIVLEASTANRQPTEFRVDPPQTGTVTAPERVAESKDKAMVIYQAPANPAIAADKFTFRVRHRDTVTSGSATVTVQIVDQKPLLAGPELVDFGEVFVGESAVRSIEVKNAGTGPFEGVWNLPAPFRRLPDNAPVRVEPGETTLVRVGFDAAAGAPGRPVERSWALAGGKPVILRALSGHPIAAQPSWAMLKWIPERRCREGTLTVQNRTSAELAVDLSLGSRLKASAAGEPAASRWTFPPEGTRELLLTLPAEDVKEFKGEIVLTARGSPQVVAVSAAPAGPWLRLESAVTEPPSVAGPESTLQVPKLPGKLTLTLRNAGGEPAALFAEVAQGFQVTGEALGKTLKPETDTIVTVTVGEGVRQAPSGELTFTFGGESLKFSLQGAVPSGPLTASSEANAFLSKGGPRNTGSTEAAPELSMDDRQLKQMAMLQNIGIFPAGTLFDRSLPDVTAGGQPRFSPSEATFVMKDLGPDFTFVIFRAVSKTPPGGTLPMKYWIPWENVVQKRLPGVVECTLKPIQPGLRYVICVAAKHADGRMGLATDPVFFYPPSRSWAWLGYTLLGIGAVVGGIFWRLRRKNADLEIGG